MGRSSKPSRCAPRATKLPNRLYSQTQRPGIAKSHNGRDSAGDFFDHLVFFVHANFSTVVAKFADRVR